MVRVKKEGGEKSIRTVVGIRRGRKCIRRESNGWG
jgi:hypothetical protein